MTIVKHRTRWIAAAVAVPVVIFIGVLATSSPPSTRAADSPLLGKPAPAIAGDTVDGPPFKLTDLRGRWVVVNFFATWCTPCVKEQPDLVQFAQRHQAANDAAIVSVIYSDSVSAVRDFRQKRGGDWPLVVDDHSRIALDYGVSGVPESYLISPDGKVAAKLVGGIAVDDLDKILTQVQSGASPRS